MRRKKKAEIAEKEAPATEQVLNVPGEQEYRSYVIRAKGDLDRSLSELEEVAEALKVSAKRITKVKGVFASKLSRRKEAKYGAKLGAYKDNLAEYFELSSRTSWLMRTLSSCYEGLARAQKSARAAAAERGRCEKILANAAYRKAKIEKKLDGVVMPVTNYAK